MNFIINKTILITACFALFFGKLGFSQQNDSANTLKNSDSLNNFEYNLKIASEFLKKSNYDSALFYYNLSIKIAVEKNDTNKLARANKYIGKVHIYRNDLEISMHYFETALELFKSINNIKGEANCLNDIGSIYIKQEKLDKALNNFNTALDIAKKNNFPEQAAAIYIGNIGMVYGLKKEYEKERNYYFDIIKIFEKNNKKDNLASVYYFIARSYYNNKKYNQVEIYSNKSIEIAKEIGAKPIITDNYSLLSKTSKAIGDFEIALEYYTIYKQYSDTLINAANNDYISDLKVKYETEQKQIEIDLKNKEIEKQLYVIWGLSIGLLVLLIVIILVFYIVIKQKHNNRVLLKQNRELIEKERELVKYKEELTATLEKTDTKQIEGVESTSDLHYNLMMSMNKDKVFKNYDLTIVILAEMLGTNKSYLSKLINDKYKQNFNMFLNSYRINEARKLLSDKNNSKYTIASISEEVGFKSISTFNRAFKEETGLTPSYFMKNV